jgi:hypothetical protein
MNQLSLGWRAQKSKEDIATILLFKDQERNGRITLSKSLKYGILPTRLL